jgi:N-terminal acetyltransferase B complex non-catalytic subunit
MSKHSFTFSKHMHLICVDWQDSSDIVSCITFAIFVNAWNSSQNHTEKAGQKTISWEVVDKLIIICFREKLSSMGPAVTSTGNEVLVLVRIPFLAYFDYAILLLNRLLLGKRRKKSGPTNKQNMNIPLLKALQTSISCMSNAIGEVNKWILDQLNKPEDHDLDVLMSYLAVDDSLGPRKVLNVLKDSLGEVDKSEVGDRIYDLVKSWDPTFVLRKIVRAQRKVLIDFSQICDSKLRVLESLKQSI